VQQPAPATAAAFEQAVHTVAETTAALLVQLPPRRQPPATLPPLRRPAVRARLGREGQTRV
jgi:hypothetical protein